MMRNMDKQHPVPFRHRLTVRLTAGVVLVLLVIGVPFLLAFLWIQRNQQIETLTETTTGLSQVILDGLRSTMLAGHPHLLLEAIHNLSKRPEVERVILLDHQGWVLVSTDMDYEGKILKEDDSCAVCHRTPGELPMRKTAVTQQEGRGVFRAVNAIPNEPVCHPCHDSAATTNGILLMDLKLSAANQQLLVGFGSTVALGLVMVIVTIGVLVLLLNSTVHQPLRSVITASQKIVQGDLGARARVSSPGEFGLLATHVNRMTDHLSKSLQTVDTQRQQLQTILDTIDDEIVVLDRHRRVIAANEAFRARKNGPSGEPVAGESCCDVFASEWDCVTEGTGGCPVERVFQTGQLQKAILSRPTPDGRERTIEIYASPMRGPDGEIHQVVEVRRDISERREMEANMAQSERLASLGLLASGLSHEINNPLAAISTSVDGLRRRLDRSQDIPKAPKEKLDQSLERIAKEVDRGRTITHRLLKVARPSDSRRSLVDINRVIEDILAILSHDVKRNNITTQIELGKSLPPLLEEESRLGQVIMNLTMNSIQAMASETNSGGTLRVATSSQNGVIQFVIEDTGCGISPDLMGRIYEPFFTTKPVGKGTGLGLFVTHRLVTEMGGTIQASSRLGLGTVVTVRIPRPEKTENRS